MSRLPVRLPETRLERRGSARREAFRFLVAFIATLAGVSLALELMHSVVG